LLHDPFSGQGTLTGEAWAERREHNGLPGQALPARKALAHIDTWVFDLDNTLYPADCDLWPKIDQRITLYIGQVFGLDGMSSRALQKYYYERYGTTLRGLMDEYALGPHDFMHFTHDIDRSCLMPDPALAGAVTALPGRKLILTNGSRDHALQTASALGLDALFDAIFDIADADFVPKPAAQTYERFLDRHGVDPARAVMFDDLARNLIVPHEKGMTTVLVSAKVGPKAARESFEHPPAEAPYIDFTTDNLAEFLAGFAPAGPIARAP